MDGIDFIESRPAGDEQVCLIIHFELLHILLQKTLKRRHEYLFRECTDIWVSYR